VDGSDSESNWDSSGQLALLIVLVYLKRMSLDVKMHEKYDKWVNKAKFFNCFIGFSNEL
jgi:hypothetical protein